MTKIKVSIIGASGYTGIEMIRLLSLHPNVDILYLFSQSDDLFLRYPHLNNFKCGEVCNDFEKISKESDVIFTTLPHGAVKKYMDILTSGNAKIVDISSDFRIKDKELHEKYYTDHRDNNNFVYGFIEKNINLIKDAKYVSNPGCFALCMQLTLLPFIEYIKRVDIFAMTGSSGGGKSPSDTNHHSTRSKNIFSYNVCKHRHNAEVYQSFPMLNDENFSFVPSSGPFTRGIFLNAFIELNSDIDCSSIVGNFYKNDKFCRVQSKIELTNVAGSNYFDIAICKNGSKNVIIQSAIDNLIKGAVGNAVQCMNLMFGLDQSTGLDNVIPFYL